MKPVTYVNFNERGLQPIVDELDKKHQQKVVGIKAPNMAKREDGFMLKTAMFTFESGQKLEIKIKANGSIYQAKLNSKVIPVKNSEQVDDPTNLAKAIAEVAGYIKRNEPNYLKQQRRRAARKIKDSEPSPRASSSTKKQLAEAKSTFEDVKQTLADTEQDIAEVQSTIGERQTELNELQSELATLTEKNNALKAELAELQEAA